MSYKEYQKEYYKNNKEKMDKRAIIWQTAHPESIMISSAKSRSKKNGLTCSITAKDIHIPERCPYLGVFLERGVGRGGSDNSPSLDRIDISKGYIPGNIQVISNKANRIKTDATADELITIGTAMKNQGL